MKKMMKTLALALVALMVLSTAAIAEVLDVETDMAQEVVHEAQPAAEESVVTEEPAAAPVEEFTVSAPVVEETAVVEEIPAPVAEDEIPAPIAEAEETVEITDEEVPLSAGFAALSVEIVADNMQPRFGENVTLRSFVVNPAAAALSYQWQINRGNGWENIDEANGTEFNFNYDESVSGCSFRVFVDYAAA